MLIPPGSFMMGSTNGSSDYAGDLDSMAWYQANSGGKIHPVGGKQSNGFGLYDMQHSSLLLFSPFSCARSAQKLLRVSRALSELPIIQKTYDLIKSYVPIPVRQSKVGKSLCGFAAPQCGKAPPYRERPLLIYYVEAQPRRNHREGQAR